MQSWGTRSRFSHRDCGHEPSKSGVVGLLAAALGVRRDDTRSLARLAALTMGVRADREGLVAVDFQTAGGGTAGGKRYGVANARGGRFGTVTSTREYLADASFLVALSGDSCLLREADEALRNPCWPPYLGRRGYVPAMPPGLGLMPGRPGEVLARISWRRRAPGERLPDIGLRVTMDTADGDGDPRRDIPVSFRPDDRRYLCRQVVTTYVRPPIHRPGAPWPC